MWRFRQLVLAPLALLAGTGCVPQFKETTNPVPTQWFEISEAAPRDSTLLIMLPGRRSSASDFESEGFIEAIRPEDRTDAVTVDLHLGYYREKILDQRLREDVIEPAIAKGYRRIELLGISLGGLGGLIYAFEFPLDIDRFTLLAPYVGDRPIQEEIEMAGGLAAWEPGVVEESDFQRRLWKELKDWAEGTGDAAMPDLRIAVGTEDRHRESNEFFANELLGGEILQRPGGHDWDNWRSLYRELFSFNPPQSP